MSYNAKNYTEQGGDKTVIGGTLEIKDGATVTGLAANPLTAATASALGGVKVGETLEIENGVLDVKPAENQAESEAEELAELVEDFNTLLAALKAAGLMAADEE